MDYCRQHDLPVPQNKAEMVKCVLQSLAFKYKQAVEKLNRCLPSPIRQLNIIGGGSQNKLLNQLTADALGIPVYAGPVEATAIGNILTKAMAKGEISKSYDDSTRVYVNNEGLEGELCLSIDGMNTIWFGNYYWIIMGAIGILLIVYFVVSLNKRKSGKQTVVIAFLDSVSHYKFLISQLVKRDFKTKYKRSVLGVCWSFLNPLLMMLVQYVVFSTIFSSGVANYPVYLLSGIVMFNFFNECCAMGISAITSNSSLITKVYVPKYIYPLSRAMSSLVNLGFSLIPLLIVTFVTGLWPRPAFILLPFPIICMMIFSLGMSYFLSTSMVFFKDTQFIWNVLSTVWLYATPIFYTENIITSPILLKAFHCNPMYQFIYFVRSILIDGVSPSPQHYLYCILLSVVPFILGFWFFKKNEDKFIFNL